MTTRRRELAGHVALACALAAATHARAELPAVTWRDVVTADGFLAALPACEAPTVAAEGWIPWRGHETNDALLLPPAFRRSATNAWTDGVRAVTLAGESEPFPFTAEDLAARCLVEVGSRHAVIVKSTRGERSWAAWAGSSHAGGLVLTLKGTEGDGPLLRTIVATLLGPYPFGSGPAPARRMSTCGVALRLDALDEPVPASHGAVHPASILMARVENRGDATVTLVRPGDGSDEGVRTPVVELAFRPSREARSILPGGRTCAREPPRAGDLLILRPGEACILSSRLSGPGLRRSASHRVRMTYRNHPSMPWISVIEAPTPEVVELIRSSTPCRMRSNEVTIRAARPSLAGVPSSK